MTTSETTTMRAKTEVILERYPYRFVQKGLLEENGAPDFRIQSSMTYRKDTTTCIILTQQHN